MSINVLRNKEDYPEGSRLISWRYNHHNQLQDHWETVPEEVKSCTWIRKKNHLQFQRWYELVNLKVDFVTYEWEVVLQCELRKPVNSIFGSTFSNFGTTYEVANFRISKYSESPEFSAFRSIDWRAHLTSTCHRRRWKDLKWPMKIWRMNSTPIALLTDNPKIKPSMVSLCW